jgi:hypothetical protein
MVLKLDNPEEYAEILQKKYESYMDDYADKTGMTVQQLITKYAGRDATITTMYNTDIILGFLADYYDYYTHAIGSDAKISDEEWKEKIEEINEEYEIFEKLIYGISKRVSVEEKEGRVLKLSRQEFEDGLRADKEDRIEQNANHAISDDELKQASKWIRSSYYTYLEKYQNTDITLVLPDRREIVFQIEDKKLPHLLGIQKEKNSAFELMKQIIKMSNPNLSKRDFTKIKYKNFIFQNYRILEPNEPLIVHYDVINSASKKNDCKVRVMTKLKDKVYRYISLGLNLESKDTHIHFAQSITAEKSAEPFIGKTTQTTINSAVFARRGDKPELIGAFSVKEQTKFIKDLLEEDPDEGRVIYYSLEDYLKRMHANSIRVENAIVNMRDIQSELSASKRK